MTFPDEYIKCLTFADVHLVAVKSSEGLGSAWQTHGPHVPLSAGHLLPDGPSQSAVHQRLQHLHCANTHMHVTNRITLSELLVLEEH